MITIIMYPLYIAHITKYKVNGTLKLANNGHAQDLIACCPVFPTSSTPTLCPKYIIHIPHLPLQLYYFLSEKVTSEVNKVYGPCSICSINI